MECLAPPLSEVPSGDWYCPVCEPIVMAQHRIANSEESDNSTVVANLEFSSSSSSSSDSEGGSTSFEPRRKTRRMGAQLQILQSSSGSESETGLGEVDDSDSGPQARSGLKRSGRLQILTEESSESESEKGDDPLFSHLAVVRRRKRRRRMKPPRAVSDSDIEVDVLTHPTVSTQVHRRSRQGTASLPKKNSYCSNSGEVSRFSVYISDDSSVECNEETVTQITENEFQEHKHHNETIRKLCSGVAVDVQRLAVLPGSKRKEPSGSELHSQHSASTSERVGKPERKAKRKRTALSREQDANQVVTIVSSNNSDDDGTSICSGYCSPSALPSSVVLHQSESDSEYMPYKTPGSPSNRRVLRPRHPHGTATNSGVPLLEGLSDDFEEHISDETGDKTYSRHVRHKPASKGKKSTAKSKRKGKGKAVSKGKGKRQRKRRRKGRKRRVRARVQNAFAVVTPIRTRARTAATHTPRESLFRRAVIESHQHENISKGLERARAVLYAQQRKESLQRSPFRSGATAMLFGSGTASSSSRVITTPQSGYRTPLGLFSSAKKSDLRFLRADATATPSSYGRLVGSLGQLGRAGSSGRTDWVTSSVPSKRKLSMEVSSHSPCAEKLEEKSPQS